MPILNRERLAELLTVRSPYCLSMYFPTIGDEAGHRQDRIHFRELLLRAEDELAAAGMVPREASRLLQAGEELKCDEAFWKHCSDGVALFLAAGWFRVYQVPHAFPDLVVVGSRFHLRPLLPLLRDDRRFYVLALNAERAQLYEATRQSIRKVASTLDIDGEERLLVRARDGRHRDSGNGGRADSKRADLLQFFRKVDEVVREILAEVHAPLVLACVGYLAPLYESINSYPQLVHEKVPGNPHIWTIDELREQAGRLVEPRFRKRPEAATAACRQAGT